MHWKINKNTNKTKLLFLIHVNPVPRAFIPRHVTFETSSVNNVFGV